MIIVIARLRKGGQVAPKANAKARLTEPATSPLTEAIHVASGDDTCRVRLLSTPQAKQAPSTANVGHNPSKIISPGQLKITAPATIAVIPKAIRQLKFSLKKNHASRAVNTLSAFNNNDALDAGIPVSPSISNTGPKIPPVNIAPANHGTSARDSLPAGAWINLRYNRSPTTAPK